MTPDELTELLAEEERYILQLKKKWRIETIEPSAERYLRLGKRTELLGNLQATKHAPVELKR